MTEVEWAKAVCGRLNATFPQGSSSARKLLGDCNTRLPYRNEIFSYGPDGDAQDMKPTSYATDILVKEIRADGTWMPRVVVETKLKISTHDALTYSSKAETHKQVHPYLRYGILIAGAEAAVPVRLFRHGAHFDFMVMWKNQTPTVDEWKKTIDLLAEEIETSRSIQQLISPKDNKSKKRYTVIRKKLIFDA